MFRVTAQCSLDGVGVWDFVRRARADEAEDKAVALVEKLGGKVTRDEKLPGKPVAGVALFFSAVTDAELKELAALKNLTYLDRAHHESDERERDEGTGRTSRTSPTSTRARNKR